MKQIFRTFLLTTVVGLGLTSQAFCGKGDENKGPVTTPAVRAPSIENTPPAPLGHFGARPQNSSRGTQKCGLDGLLGNHTSLHMVPAYGVIIDTTLPSIFYNIRSTVIPEILTTRNELEK